MKRNVLIAIILVTITAVPYVAYTLYSASQSWAKFYGALENGDPGAETKLCSFFSRGNPLYPGDAYPQNYAKAMMWCRRAADEGYAEAQFRIGQMYWRGEGVPKDLVQSYMWMLLAAKQNPRVVAQNIPVMERFLTPDQVAEAKRRASEWKPVPNKAETSAPLITD